VASLLGRLAGYDVVHVFSASYWSFLLAPFPAMVVGRLYGKQVLLNYRSGEADDHLTRWRRTAVPGMRLAHAIVVPSAYLVDVFSRHGLRATSIFNFVEVDRIPYRPRPRPRPVFLSNRNFEPLYNVACVLRAFARVQGEVPEASLIVAGDGSQRVMLERLAAELGVSNVTFVGRRQPNEMQALYGQADVYLNAPDIDNMPNSILEAFAAGLPVVTSDAGGIPYIVDHDRNGLVVPRGNDAALAAAALRVLREPGLADRLSATARQDCLSHYVWSSVGTDWAQLYRSLAAASGKPLAVRETPA
jgi:glycosyltransferase involved in cell wall biosynthesis